VVIRAREAMVELLHPRAPHLPPEALRGALDAATRAIISYVLTPSERSDDVVAADLAAMLMATLRDPAPDGDARGGASRSSAPTRDIRPARAARPAYQDDRDP
jgi:hypothetical protein